MEQDSDPELRAYVVWLPILTTARMGLGHSAARRESAQVADPRATHYWDPESRAGEVFREMIGLPEGSLAWDVFFVFGPEARWGGEPPRPDFWMHQLSPRWWREADREAALQNLLDGGELRRQIQEIRSNSKTTAGSP